MLSKDEAGWTPCSEGTLGKAIERVQTKRRRASILRMGASAFIGTLALVIASIYLSPKSVEQECPQVAGLLAEYASGDLNQVSKGIVDAHLSRCKKCRSRLDELKASEMNTQSVAASPWMAFPNELLLSFIDGMPLPINR